MKRMAVKKTKSESFEVSGDKLVGKFKELVHQGNIRKIKILDKDKKTLVEFPLTFGVVGVALAPVLAAVGAIAALITECTIMVERKTD
jgi:hypothetical protein